MNENRRPLTKVLLTSAEHDELNKLDHAFRSGDPMTREQLRRLLRFYSRRLPDLTMDILRAKHAENVAKREELKKSTPPVTIATPIAAGITQPLPANWLEEQRAREEAIDNVSTK